MKQVIVIIMALCLTSPAAAGWGISLPIDDMFNPDKNGVSDAFDPVKDFFEDDCYCPTNDEDNTPSLGNPGTINPERP